LILLVLSQTPQQVVSKFRFDLVEEREWITVFRSIISGKLLD
jgi:hypothetical protein